MAAIVWWWAIPGIALVGAICWAAWATRTPRAPSMRESMARYEQWRSFVDRVLDTRPREGNE